MDDFRQEVREMSTSDLMLILQDQQDLYSEEEICILSEELASRPDNAIDLEEAERERALTKARELAAQEARRRRYEHDKKVNEERLLRLKANGYEGYYEYLTLSLFDNDGGAIAGDQISMMLNDYALDGWRLVTAYSNEVGRNVNNGINATIDQNVLILERFIRF